MKKIIFLISTFIFVSLTSLKLVGCSNNSNSSSLTPSGLDNNKISLNYLAQKINNSKNIYGAKNNKVQDFVDEIKTNFVTFYNKLGQKNILTQNELNKDLGVDVYLNSKKLKLNDNSINFKNYKVYLKTKAVNNFFNGNATLAINVKLTQENIAKYKKDLNLVLNSINLNEIPFHIKQKLGQDYLRDEKSKSLDTLINIEKDKNISIKQIKNNSSKKLQYLVNISKNDQFFFATSNFKINNVVDNFKMNLNKLNLTDIVYAQNGQDLYQSVFELLNNQYGKNDYINDPNLIVGIYYFKNNKKQLIENNINAKVYYYQKLQLNIKVLQNDTYFLKTNYCENFQLTKIDLSKIKVSQNNQFSNFKTLNDVLKNVAKCIVQYFNSTTNTKTILSVNQLLNDLNINFSFYDLTKKLTITNFSNSINKFDSYDVNININSTNKYFINNWINYTLTSFCLNNQKKASFDFSNLKFASTKQDLKTKIYQVLLQEYNENTQAISNYVSIKQLENDANIKIDLSSIKDSNLIINKQYQFKLTILENDSYFQATKNPLIIKFIIPKLNNLNLSSFVYPNQKSFVNLKDFLIPTYQILANQYNQKSLNKISANNLLNDSNLKIYFTYNSNLQHLNLESNIDNNNVLQIHFNANKNDKYFAKQDLIIKTINVNNRIKTRIVQNYVKSLQTNDISFLNKTILLNDIVNYLNNLQIFKSNLTISTLTKNNSFVLNLKTLYQTKWRKDYHVTITTKNNYYFLDQNISFNVYLAKANLANFEMIHKNFYHVDINDRAGRPATAGDMRDIYEIPALVDFYNKTFPNLKRSRQLTFDKIKKDKNISFGFYVYYFDKTKNSHNWNWLMKNDYYDFFVYISPNDPYFYSSGCSLVIYGDIWK